MNKKREANIELLRLLAMVMVVILHSLGHGGILYTLPIDDNKFKIIWFLEICSYCAVNIFGLISGYVSYQEEEKKVKISNYIKLWFEVVFYSLLITIVLNNINPSVITKENYIKSFLPVTYNNYWYFTAYTGVFIFMPLINKAIRSCSTLSLKKLFICIIIMFSMLNTFANNFALNNGYSFIWLLLLFTLGSIIKKCQIGKKLNTIQIICLLITLNIITFLYYIYGTNHDLYGIKITNKLLLSYTSPTILLAGILNILLFSKIKINNTFSKIINYLSTSSFAIYLLNDNYLVRDNYIINSFIKLASKPGYEIILKVLLFALVFSILAIIIDKIRYYLFEFLKINKLSELLESLLTKVFNKLVNYY